VTSSSALWARRITAVSLLAAFVVVLAVIILWQTNLPVRLFEDWRWYQDGALRLMSGRPLYDPVYLHGPYDQTDPAVMGKYNQWPALAVALVAFEAAIPEAVREPLWGLLMAAFLVVAFALVWPRSTLLVGTALALIVALLPATWLALRTANVASAVALGVTLTIVGQRRQSTGLVALGLLLAGIAKVLPAAPLVLWLLVRHRAWRPVVLALAVGGALTAVAVVLQGPSVIWDFVVTSAGQLPLALWTNVAPAYLLAPYLGGLATPVSLAAAAVLVAAALRRRASDGSSLLLLTAASCLALPTTHVFWWLSPMVVVSAFYGDRLVKLLGLLFDWHADDVGLPRPGRQAAGSNLT
jgi:hypothetical protein